MKTTAVALFFLFSVNWMVSAKDWYVSGTGNDSNDGQSLKTAFRTLQKAENEVQPGDVVWIGNGIYSNGGRSNSAPVLSVTRSGKAGAWITWKAVPGQKPEIRPQGWAGIEISGSYQIFDGITVKGNNDSITLIAAQEDAKKEVPDAFYNTNGIIVDGRKNSADQKPHHVTIRNCVVCKCAGGGIVGIETDYMTIEDCRVFDNAWFMRYGGSGISTIENWAYDDAPGYHFIIQRNYVWNNKTLVPWVVTGKLSDGNGIILDVSDQERHGPTNPNADKNLEQNADTTKKQSTATVSHRRPRRPEWNGRSLIANNLSAFNGGSGIHTFRTKHVDIINNTTYCNGGIVGYQELFPNSSEDLVIMNNIIVPRPGGEVTSNYHNTNIRWDYNLYPASQDVFKGEHDLVANPEFIDIRPDIVEGDFRLVKGSPGRDSGTDEFLPETDITGKARPIGKGCDRGAFEQ